MNEEQQNHGEQKKKSLRDLKYSIGFLILFGTMIGLIWAHSIQSDWWFVIIFAAGSLAAFLLSRTQEHDY